MKNLGRKMAATTAAFLMFATGLVLTAASPASAGCGTWWLHGTVDNNTSYKTNVREDDPTCSPTGTWTLNAWYHSNQLPTGGGDLDVDRYHYRGYSFKHYGAQVGPWSYKRIVDTESMYCQNYNIHEGGVFIATYCD